jgi:hypothetical protein
MRDVIAMRSARIASALHRGDGNADAAEIEKHASLILAAMLDHITAERARGFDIGQDSSGFYARPRSSTAGMARELRDLRLICIRAIVGKISYEEWTAAWAAVPERTKRWKPRLIETKQQARRDGAWIRRAGVSRDIDSSMLALGFAVAGFVMLAPKPQIMLPIIERELAKLRKNPKSKARSRDAEAAVAIGAVKAACRATGTRFAALGREVDAIFGTTLFAARGSTRLR